MATQLAGPVMPIRTVSFLFLAARLSSNICHTQKNLIHFCWNLVHISTDRESCICFCPQQSDDDKSPESLHFFDETFEPFL